MVKSSTCAGLCFAALGLLTVSTAAQAQVLGMVGDDETDRAMVFDTETHTILGAVPIGPGAVGDCEITPDQRLGLMVDFGSRLWLIDLDASPPALASGVNPIALSSLGQDVVLSHDEQFALVCGGSDIVSVVDLASRTEVEAFDLGHGCQAVEVCDDGSVLVGWLSIPDGQLVRRLTLDDMGQLTDTGDSFVPDFPTNLHCAPGSASALVLQLGGDVSSVAVAGLTPLDQVSQLGASATAVFHPDEDRVSIRGDDVIEVYDFDAATGDLGDVPELTITNTGDFVPLGGVDTLALDAESNLLYASDLQQIKIFDALTGTPQPSISEPGARFSGVCLGDGSLVFRDGFESGDTSAWSASTPDPNV